MNKDRTDILAFLISALTSPFLILTFIPLFIIYNKTLPNDFWTLGIYFIIFVSVIPFLYVCIGVIFKKYSDIHLAIREQRFMPLVISNFSCLILIIVYQHLKAPLTVIALIITMVLCGTLYLIITNYWKISMHTGAFAGSVTSLGWLIERNYFYLLLLLPVIMWARIKRDRHNPAQGLLGAMLMILSTTLIYRIFGIIG